MISPIIHRLQPELDPHQQAVVGHLEGPLLVIAGPGAGKTRCLVWRAVNLLLLGRVSPAELVMCTFSKRAAHELRQRFRAAAEQARLRPATLPPCASPPATASAVKSCANTPSLPAPKPGRRPPGRMGSAVPDERPLSSHLRP